MMKTNVKAYKVIVGNGKNLVILICMTYQIDTAGKYFGSEFYELANSFDQTGFSIPSNRGATFQEELRVTGKGYSITPEYREEIEKWIADKMKEAYGMDVTVTVDDFAKSKTYSVNQKRQEHAQAYMPWESEDDNKLEILFCEGKTLKELSQIFKRNEGAISSRIKKLELKEKYNR